jgi:CHAD domain-containing protein
VAPLAASVVATLAASAALRVGVAIARAERERRDDRQRRAAERQFALLGAEPALEGLRRMALGQLDLAIEMMDAPDGSPPDEKAVHETRKALKRLRALVRLLRPELGEEAFARESAALRGAGRRLAAARDAEVMVSTLDGVLKRAPRKLARRRRVRELRRAVVAERELAAARAIGDAAWRAQVLDELWAIRHRVIGWRLEDTAGIETIEPGLQRIYRQGRNRYRRAARGKGDRGRALHEWRKRVKDLRYAAEMLDRREPAAGGSGARRKRGGKPARTTPVGKLARRADELAEVLGEEHDLAVLAERIGAGTGRQKLGRRSRKALQKPIARRRRKLRARALREGARLYRRRPKRFVRWMRRAFERAELSRR